MNDRAKEQKDSRKSIQAFNAAFKKGFGDKSRFANTPKKESAKDLVNRTQAAADAATAFMNEQAASAGTAELSQGDFLPKEIQAIRWRPKE